MIGFVGFFVIWQVGSDAGWIDKFFVSSPLDIIGAAVREVQLPRFWNDLRVSMTELAGGLLLAVALGVPIGLAIGWYTRVSYTFDPWLNFFNSLPRIALLPLIVLWVGLGLEAKLIVIFLGGFFSIAISTTQGVKTVDKALLDVATSFRAKQRKVFTAVVLPGSLPFILTGLRLAVGRCLIGVIIGELYAQTEGIGVMIGKASATFQSDRMFFGILIFTLSGIFFTEIIRLFERRVQRWRPALEQDEG